MRPSVTEVSIQFLGGLMSVEVDWMPVASKKKAVQFKTICPECKTEKPCEQWYLCDEKGHGPYKTGQLARAMEIGKALKRVTPEQVAAVKEPELEPKVLLVEQFPAAQVDATTRWKGDVWWIKPRKNPGLVALVAQLVANPDVAFVGEVNLGAKLGQKFVRLYARNGTIEIVELARPEELNPIEDIGVSYDTAMLAKATMFCETLVEDFDPKKFASRVRQRGQDLASKLNDGAPVETKKPAAKKDAEVDLMAALDAALAGLQKAS